MDFELKGKTALVTGSTAGIGFATAHRLAAEGAKVVITGRTEARVEAAVARVRESVSGAEVLGVAVDLSDEAGVDALLAQVPSTDVLVNNLGIFEPVAWDALSWKDYTQMFETNVVSGALLSQKYLAGMFERGFGSIVFISSESAQQIPAEMIHYGVSKAAQAAVARGLAEVTRGTAVRVNTVLAGPTKSEGVIDFVKSLAEQGGKTVEEVEADFFREARPTSLLQRFTSPEEVADAIAFLCSPRASAITGAAVRAEGGVVKTVF